MNPSLLKFRDAQRDDLPTIVRLLADDALGIQRERFEEPLADSYYQAFEAIEGDPHNMLLVAERQEQLVAVLQLTFIPNLTYQGRWRAQIEGVRVVAERRGEGIGRALIEHAVERSRAAGCHLIQLTTDKARPEAVGFYESLGFRATHEGMRRPIAGGLLHAAGSGVDAA